MKKVLCAAAAWHKKKLCKEESTGSVRLDSYQRTMNVIVKKVAINEMPWFISPEQKFIYYSWIKYDFNLFHSYIIRKNTRPTICYMLLLFTLESIDAITDTNVRYLIC